MAAITQLLLTLVRAVGESISLGKKLWAIPRRSARIRFCNRNDAVFYRYLYHFLGGPSDPYGAHGFC